MTTRTIQLIGSGFGQSTATVIATLNNKKIFNSTVPTIDLPVPQPPTIFTNWVPLFTFEIPMDFVGNIPMTCETTNGTVIFTTIFANYSKVRIPTDTGGYYETRGPNSFIDIFKFNKRDPRNNTTLNGHPYAPPCTPGKNSTRWWIIPQDTVLGYDLEIAQAGI